MTPTLKFAAAATATATAFFWEAYFASSSALRRIPDAPSARVSGLRSLLNDSDTSGKLVVVRGQVQTGPAGWLAWMGLKNPDGALVAQQSGKLAVIVQQVDKQFSLYVGGKTMQLDCSECSSLTGKNTTKMNMCEKRGSYLESFLSPPKRVS